MSCASRTVIRFLRMLDAVAQRVRAAGLAVVVLRLPDVWPGPWSISIGASMTIEDGRVAIVERRRVDERLERRARLAHGLRRAVELGLVEGKAADHGEHAAGVAGPWPRCAPETSGIWRSRNWPGCPRSARHRSRRRRCSAWRAALAAPAHFRPSGGIVPVSRSATDLAGRSRAGLQADARLRRR